MWGLGQSTRGFAIVGHSRTPDSLKLIELPVDLKKKPSSSTFTKMKKGTFMWLKIIGDTSPICLTDRLWLSKENIESIISTPSNIYLNLYILFICKLFIPSQKI